MSDTLVPTVLQRPAPTAQGYGKPEEYLNPNLFRFRVDPVVGTDRTRWTTAAELACLAGIAPVMERSGQSVWIRWRYFCPKFMRQSFHEYAGESVKHSFWARACSYTSNARRNLASS